MLSGRAWHLEFVRQPNGPDKARPRRFKVARDRVSSDSWKRRRRATNTREGERERGREADNNNNNNNHMKLSLDSTRREIVDCRPSCLLAFQV